MSCASPGIILDVGGRAGVVAWVVAGVVLVACGALAAMAQDDETGAYRFGSALGAILLPLLVAAIAWKLGTALARRPQPLWNPWMALMAATIGVALLVARVGREARDESAGAADRAERCIDERAPFGAAPGGLRYVAAGSAEVEQVRARMPEDRAYDVEIRVVKERGERIGVLLAFADDGGHDDFVAGARDGAEDQGGTVEDVRIGGQEALLLELPDRVTVVGTRGCASVSVTGADRRSARLLAEPVLG